MFIATCKVIMKVEKLSFYHYEMPFMFSSNTLALKSLLFDMKERQQEKLPLASFYKF